MIELKLHINNTKTLMSVKAVRIHPTARQPKVGENCIYLVNLNGIESGKISHPFGDGISLGKKMFEHYELIADLAKGKDDDGN